MSSWLSLSWELPSVGHTHCGSAGVWMPANEGHYQIRDLAKNNWVLDTGMGRAPKQMPEHETLHSSDTLFGNHSSHMITAWQTWLHTQTTPIDVPAAMSTPRGVSVMVAVFPSKICIMENHSSLLDPGSIIIIIMKYLTWSVFMLFLVCGDLAFFSSVKGMAKNAIFMALQTCHFTLPLLYYLYMVKGHTVTHKLA